MKAKGNGASMGTARIDASLALDDMGLLPEEVAVLKMIHSVDLE